MWRKRFMVFSLRVIKSNYLYALMSNSFMTKELRKNGNRPETVGAW